MLLIFQFFRKMQLQAFEQTQTIQCLLIIRFRRSNLLSLCKKAYDVPLGFVITELLIVQFVFEIGKILIKKQLSILKNTRDYILDGNARKFFALHC